MQKLGNTQGWESSQFESIEEIIGLFNRDIIGEDLNYDHNFVDSMKYIGENKDAHNLFRIVTAVEQFYERMIKNNNMGGDTVTRVEALTTVAIFAYLADKNHNSVEDYFTKVECNMSNPLGYMPEFMVVCDTVPVVEEEDADEGTYCDCYDDEINDDSLWELMLLATAYGYSCPGEYGKAMKFVKESFEAQGHNMTGMGGLFVFPSDDICNSRFKGKIDEDNTFRLY